MNKQINQRWQSLLLATIATFIVLGASGLVFAQNNGADKYPKPDFSAMEEYWEVVEYEYDFTTMVPELIVVAKLKQKVVPVGWDITWLDSKGVKMERFMLYFSPGQIQRSKVGDVIRGSSKAPFKRFMSQVKSITVTENPDAGDAKTGN